MSPLPDRHPGPSSGGTLQIRAREWVVNLHWGSSPLVPQDLPTPFCPHCLPGPWEKEPTSWASPSGPQPPPGQFLILHTVLISRCHPPPVPMGQAALRQEKEGWAVSPGVCHLLKLWAAPSKRGHQFRRGEKKPTPPTPASGMQCPQSPKHEGRINTKCLGLTKYRNSPRRDSHQAKGRWDRSHALTGRPPARVA